MVYVFELITTNEHSLVFFTVEQLENPLRKKFTCQYNHGMNG